MMPSENVLQFLENRNRSIGAMYAADLSADYCCILFTLMDFRRNHELEVLRDDLFQAVSERCPISCTGEPYDLPRFDAELAQLDDWKLVGKRLEKARLRSYRDVRRDRFRYSLPDESAAFLIWLEERREHDLMPRDDDSINLLEFILSSLKQMTRLLKTPDTTYSNVIFALGDVEEKTNRLSRNLGTITVRLGEFLIKAYTPEEAREIVSGLDLYFKSYLQELFKLRASILTELTALQTPEQTEKLEKCFRQFNDEQARRPRLMRMGGHLQDPMHQLEQLTLYYRRDGKVDRLCNAVHENAMKVLGKLTSYLKELERRSNRLEFISLRLKELARLPEDATPTAFLRELIATTAAPLDMNDADDGQKAEPPPPRTGNGKRRFPPRTFNRTKPLDVSHVETHEEMRLRLLAEFIRKNYPQGGRLDQATLLPDDYQQLSFLLKAGLLGNGKRLLKQKLRLAVDDSQQATIHGCGGTLTGPAITLETAP